MLVQNVVINITMASGLTCGNVFGTKHFLWHSSIWFPAVTLAIGSYGPINSGHSFILLVHAAAYPALMQPEYQPGRNDSLLPWPLLAPACLTPLPNWASPWFEPNLSCQARELSTSLLICPVCLFHLEKNSLFLKIYKSIFCKLSVLFASHGNRV